MASQRSYLDEEINRQITKKMMIKPCVRYTRLSGLLLIYLISICFVVVVVTSSINREEINVNNKFYLLHNIVM